MADEARPAHGLAGAGDAHAPVGLAVTDASGTLVSVNASLCGLLGRPESQLHGMAYQDLLHPDDR
jgi:PAS domain S-box-containing protein